MSKPVRKVFFLFLLIIQHLGYAQSFDLEVCEGCLEQVIEERFRVSSLKDGQKITKGLDFTLKYDALEASEGLLFLADAQLIRVIHNEDSLWAGSFQPKANLTQHYARYLVPVLLKKGVNRFNVSISQKDEKFFYLDPALVLNAHIEQAELLFKSRNEKSRTITYLSILVLLLIAFYAFWRYMFFGQKLYRVYLIYVLSILVFLFAFCDMYFQLHYLFPNNPEQYPSFNFVLQAFIYVLYAEFGLVLLDIKRKDKLLYKVNRYFQASTLGVASFIAIVSLVFGSDATVYSHLYKLYVIPLMLSTFMHYRVIVNFKDPLKWFLIAGSVVITFSTVLEILHIYTYKMSNPRDFYFVPANGIITFGYVEICYVIETIIFLMAIGYITWRKDKSQNAYKEKTIAQLKEKERLEKQVNELLSEKLQESEAKLAFAEVSSENEKNKAKLIQSQLASLQLQMNPHYLFNSLNSINDFIISKQPQEASEYLALYARMMRNILRNSDKTLNSLEQELQFCDDYLNLESLRFEDKFNYKIIRPRELDILEFKIPSMMLQPILENAVWHGVMPLKGDGEIILDCSQSTLSKVVIRITDNGNGLEKGKLDSKHKSYGLRNIQEKIDLFAKLYEEKVEFQISDRNNSSGVLVTFLFPRFERINNHE